MLATAPSPSLPFKVTEFTNRRTQSKSWRVTGSGEKNGRVRKNFGPERGGEPAARAECDRLNADEIRAASALPPIRAMPTRLTEQELTIVDAAKERAAGKWTLAEILDTGLAALARAPKRVELAPYLDTWIAGPANELEARWRNQIEQSVRLFLAAHPGLMSTDWTVAVTRQWLDSMSVKGQTKAGYRNAVHRWARWLVETGVLAENPAAGMWITRVKDRTGLPVVYSVVQSQALFETCQQDPVCRPLLGWLTLTLLCGLRPESEAPVLRWSQIRWRERTIILRGTKRGSKPRDVPIQPAAYDFLRLVHAEAPAQPGFWTRGLQRRLERQADELLRSKQQAILPEGPDINRHTYASMRAALDVQLVDLAKEMGNDVDTLYGHYVQPISKSEALRFWAIRPR